MHLTDASPAIGASALHDALAFVREVVEPRRLHVRGGPERDAFDSVAGIYSPDEGSIVWDGDRATITDPDDRTLLLSPPPMFRTRVAAFWPMDEE